MADGFNDMNAGESAGGREVGAAGEPCEDADPAAWIEIELIDEHKEPLAGEAYWVKLPDDEVREGNLDDKGFVRIENIPPGTCVVKFPKIDKTEWKLPVRVTPADEPDEEKAWIEIELLDEKDNPVADEAYWIKLPNGDIIEGNLDAQGFARLEDIEPGTCVVKFPNVDENEIEKE